MRVLRDTNGLSEPLRERPDRAGMAQLEAGDHSLHTVSVVIHDLSYGLQCIPPGRRQQRLSTDPAGPLGSGLPMLPYDRKAALWHGEQRARLEAAGLRPPFADGQIAAIAATEELGLVTRNTADHGGFAGLKGGNWFSVP